MAILYVVLTTHCPTTIVIDEPQSFIHPGAIRKLFDILREHPQHQYIITTHSPTVVAAASPHTLYLVRKEGAETSIQSIDPTETESLRLFLRELGARLADVFGADNILWVEAPTEEVCFPLILSRLAGRPLYGTALLAVTQTGDSHGKHSHTILDIYDRLSRGAGLLPPAIGFIFDREGLKAQDRAELAHRGGNRVHFTRRRMFENYLLTPDAIAYVMNGIAGFRESPVSPEEISEWLSAHGGNTTHQANEESTEGGNDDWRNNAHGARILRDMFGHFSECRFTYDKIAHGKLLTEWLIQNSPDDLRELADLLKTALPESA